MNSTLRKLRKLFRSPKQYFADSKINRQLSSFRKDSGNKVDIKQDNAEPIFSLSTDAVFISQKQSSKIKKDNCLFLLVNNQSKDLLAKLKDFKEVVQLREDHLIPIRINRKTIDVQEWTSAELIKRFNTKDIAYLSEFKFIISVNPTDNIAKAIRACSWNSLLVCVITKESSLSFCDEITTDALICPKKLEEKTIDYRHVKIFDEKTAEDLIEKIKQCLKELCSKTPDFFIPIKYIESKIIDSIDAYNGYDAIVKFKTKNHSIAPTSKFSELIRMIEIEEILIRESLFFRYKNIIKQCQKSNDYTNLIAKMTQDGSKFYYD